MNVIESEYTIGNKKAIGYTFFKNKKEELGYIEGISSLQRSTSEVYKKFVCILKNCPFDAYFLEFPPISNKSMFTTSFEFVLIESEKLSKIKTDASAFQEYFDDELMNVNVVTFRNLGGDATLVVPCPNESVISEVYSSISKFVRGAPSGDIADLFSILSRQLIRLLDTHPNKRWWLSTSGLDVPYLHLRICETPKYYNYEPYKK